MTLKRMERVGIVGEDLATATEFFPKPDLEPPDKMKVEGPWVDRVNASTAPRFDIAMMQAPGGGGQPRHHRPPTSPRLQQQRVPLTLGEVPQDLMAQARR